MRQFLIYFADLKEDVQDALCAEFMTTPREENWDYFPLAVLERDYDEVEDLRR